MKPVERRKMVRAIRALVPDLYEKGPLLAAIPRGRVLRGIYLESSSADPHGVYVWTFVQPLFIPQTSVVLSLGERLGSGSKTWNVNEADAAAMAVRDEGLPFFGPVSTPEALANWNYLDGCADTYALETKAYSLVAAGRLKEGARYLRKLAGSITGEVPWMIEIQKRAEQLSSLAETDPERASNLLAKWEAETIDALRIQGLP